MSKHGGEAERSTPVNLRQLRGLRKLAPYNKDLAEATSAHVLERESYIRIEYLRCHYPVTISACSQPQRIGVDYGSTSAPVG